MEPDGRILVLLLGIDGNEIDLAPFAHRIAPHAPLLERRGRSTDEGTNRWFRRKNAVTFDQNDIRAEAFAAFLDDTSAIYGFDREQIVYLAIPMART